MLRSRWDGNGYWCLDELVQAAGEDRRTPSLEGISGVISGSTGLQGVQRPSQSRGQVIHRENISVDEDKIEVLGSDVAWLEDVCYGISYYKTQSLEPSS